MVAPDLPQEIIDTIIDMFAREEENLRSCSLVSTGWVYRSRHHLFVKVQLDHPSHVELWFEHGLKEWHQCVRELSLIPILCWTTRNTIEEILTSFCNVTTLRLLHLRPVNFIEFSSFQGLSENLTSLIIAHSKVDPETLPLFVSVFPKLEKLELSYITIEEATISSTSPIIALRFRGVSTLSQIKPHATCMTAPPVGVGAPLSMALREVCLKSCRLKKPESLKDLFVACNGTVKKIKVSEIPINELDSHGSFHQRLCVFQNLTFSISQESSPKLRALIYPHSIA
jgi:hypothetical protein